MHRESAAAVLSNNSENNYTIMICIERDSLIFQVDRMWAMQDYEGAHRSSKYARNLNIAGIVGSFVCLVIVAISLGLFFGLYYVPLLHIINNY